MSISVELRMTGDITTPEHQAAMKSIMDTVEQTVNQLPGVTVRPSRYETKSTCMSRMMLEDGTINPEPLPDPTGYMHEARMQFGFHLNPAAKTETMDSSDGNSPYTT